MPRSKNQLRGIATSAANFESVAETGFTLLLLITRKQNKIWKIAVFRY